MKVTVASGTRRERVRAPLSPSEMQRLAGTAPQEKQESWVVGLEQDVLTDLWRVRIYRQKAVFRGHIRGPMTVTTTRYLDGGGHSLHRSSYTVREEVLPMEAVPARTKDVTDFGRLSTAAKALASGMSRFSPANPPSEAQQTQFLMGYQNLLEWRRKARESMIRAEGEIDVVEAMLTQFL